MGHFHSSPVLHSYYVGRRLLSIDTSLIASSLEGELAEGVNTSQTRAEFF